MEDWYVAKSQPRKEKSLQTYLSDRLDLKVFFPFMRRPGHGSDSWEPLFPTYLFCRFDPQSTQWPAIRWAPGLMYFLGANRQPTTVPTEVIDHLQHRVGWWNDGGCQPSFNQGDKVQVGQGPFAGLDGIFQRYIPAKQRCRVLLHIVGRLTAVELPHEDIRAAHAYRGLLAA